MLPWPIGSVTGGTRPRGRCRNSLVGHLVGLMAHQKVMIGGGRPVSDSSTEVRVTVQCCLFLRRMVTLSLSRPWGPRLRVEKLSWGILVSSRGVKYGGLCPALYSVLLRADLNQIIFCCRADQSLSLVLANFLSVFSVANLAISIHQH